MDKDLWIAVSGTGQMCVFVDKPIRNNHFKYWDGCMVGCISMVVCLLESEGFEIPVLKWSDEPIKLSLSLNVVK